MSNSWRAGAVRVAVALSALALLSGCSGGSAADDPAPTPSESETAAEAVTDGIDQSRTFRARVHAEGTGAAPFTWTGEQDIILTRVGRPDLEVNLVSAGFELPEILTHDRSLRFRWAFDLLNAYADEPGTFEITADPINPQGLKSQAFLIWMKVKDPSKDAVFEMDEVEFYKEFRELREPCTVEVGENESTGTMTCPALASEDGEVAGLTVSWEEIAP